MNFDRHTRAFSLIGGTQAVYGVRSSLVPLGAHRRSLLLADRFDHQVVVARVDAE